MDTPPALLKWGWEKNPEVWERRFMRLPSSYHQSTSVMATDNCQPDSILKHQGDGPLAHSGELSWFRKWGVKTHPSHPLWEPGPHRWKKGAEAQHDCIASAPWLWVQCRVPTVSGSCFFGFLTLGDCTLELWARTNSYFPRKLLLPEYFIIATGKGVQTGRNENTSKNHDPNSQPQRQWLYWALVYCSLRWGNLRCSSFSSSEWGRIAPSFPKFIATCSRTHSKWPNGGANWWCRWWWHSRELALKQAFLLAEWIKTKNSIRKRCEYR